MRSKQLAGLPQAADEFEGEAEVAGACQRAVDAADPKSIDVVPSGRHLLHFHASKGTYKADLRVGVASFDFIGNGERGVNVASRAAA